MSVTYILILLLIIKLIFLFQCSKWQFLLACSLSPTKCVMAVYSARIRNRIQSICSSIRFTVSQRRNSTAFSQPALTAEYDACFSASSSCRATENILMSQNQSFLCPSYLFTNLQGKFSGSLKMTEADSIPSEVVSWHQCPSPQILSFKNNRNKNK